MAAGIHKCFAVGCTARVPSARFGCRKHWFSLPVTTRDRIWSLFNSGKVMSREYCEVAISAIREAAKREGVPVTGDEREFRLYRHHIGAIDKLAAAARKCSND